MPLPAGMSGDGNGSGTRRVASWLTRRGEIGKRSCRWWTGVLLSLFRAATPGRLPLIIPANVKNGKGERKSDD